MNSLPLDFLNRLKQNNNREWFAENKDQFNEAKLEMESFVSALIEKIGGFDKSIAGLETKKAMFRIYRDIRFSKDKTPYKTTMGSYIAPEGRKSINAAYYLHIEPSASMLAGGLYRPASDNLFKVRQEIVYNYTEFIKLIENKEFKSKFGEINGDKLKRPPKGFDADFEGIEFLKFKDYTVFHPVSDELVKSDGFEDYAIEVFKSMKPLNDFLNRALD